MQDPLNEADSLRDVLAPRSADSSNAPSAPPASPDDGQGISKRVQGSAPAEHGALGGDALDDVGGAGFASWVEGRFGQSFADVTVEGAGAGAAPPALATTAGKSIRLSSGFGSLTEDKRRRVLTHELAHVAQGKASGPAMSAGADAELDADRMTRAALGGGARVSPGVSVSSRESFAYTESEEMTGKPKEPETAPPKDETKTAECIAGYTGKDPIATLRIAWTIDDGPQGATESMNNALGQRPGTWFIQRNRLGEGEVLKGKLLLLKKLQSQGNEIAIHSFHPTQDHAAWFPKGSKYAPGVYSTVQGAMNDLASFVKLLTDAGIQVKFARMPTGEHDEVAAYLKGLDVAVKENNKGGSNDGSKDGKVSSKDREKVIGAILRGEPVDGVNEEIVQADFETIQKTLADLGLRIWSGSSPGEPDLSSNSWEAESSETAAGVRTDSFYPSVKQKGVKNVALNKLEAMVKSRKDDSLVVLCHDASEAAVEEVKRDLASVESDANQLKIRIIYSTMSNHYRKVRGQDP